jgi:hypothetical protein
MDESQPVVRFIHSFMHSRKACMGSNSSLYSEASRQYSILALGHDGKYSAQTNLSMSWDKDMRIMRRSAIKDYLVSYASSSITAGRS